MNGGTGTATGAIEIALVIALLPISLSGQDMRSDAVRAREAAWSVASEAVELLRRGSLEQLVKITDPREVLGLHETWVAVMMEAEQRGDTRLREQMAVTSVSAYAALLPADAYLRFIEALFARPLMGERQDILDIAVGATSAYAILGDTSSIPPARPRRLEVLELVDDGDSGWRIKLLQFLYSRSEQRVRGLE